MVKDEKLFGIERSNISTQKDKFNLNMIKMDEEKRTVLIHSCCGPCSTACIERLITNYDVTVFYYNPNITDRDEYEKRKESQIKFIDEYNKKLENDKVKYIEGEYIVQDYFDFVNGLENEKEGGLRCNKCFELRLLRTAKVAKELNFSYFSTTLTVSPHKNSPLISSIGNMIGEELGVDYLDIDFKKKNGYLRSIELAKEYGLYRQNYCGCEFSKWFLDVRKSNR